MMQTRTYVQTEYLKGAGPLKKGEGWNRVPPLLLSFLAGVTRRRSALLLQCGVAPLGLLLCCRQPVYDRPAAGSGLLCVKLYFKSPVDSLHIRKKHIGPTSVKGKHLTGMAANIGDDTAVNMDRLLILVFVLDQILLSNREHILDEGSSFPAQHRAEADGVAAAIGPQLVRLDLMVLLDP